MSEESVGGAESQHAAQGTYADTKHEMKQSGRDENITVFNVHKALNVADFKLGLYGVVHELAYDLRAERGVVYTNDNRGDRAFTAHIEACREANIYPASLITHHFPMMECGSALYLGNAKQPDIKFIIVFHIHKTSIRLLMFSQRMP